MKRFLKIIGLSIVVLIVIDILFGITCRVLLPRAKGGNTANEFYIAKESSEDIIMLGSSRMRRHYNPDVIENITGLSCYNAGVNGNGIILAYGLFRMIEERYSPKVVLYDISVFDVDEDENEKFLSRLRPYYDEPGIDSIFLSIDKTERIKMLSNLYRYNTLWIGILGDILHPARSYKKGYAPLKGHITYTPIPSIHPQSAIDPIREKYLRQIASDCKNKGIKLIFIISPHYLIESDNAYFDPIRALCEEYSVELWDYFEDENYSRNMEYFNDQNHLNESGAIAFSTEIANRLHKSLN